MANYLSDNSRMDKPQIKEHIEKYARGNIYSKKTSYRDMLKQKFNDMKVEKRLNQPFVERLSLNKNMETI